jgi:hypothetical protein
MAKKAKAADGSGMFRVHSPDCPTAVLDQLDGLLEELELHKSLGWLQAIRDGLADEHEAAPDGTPANEIRREIFERAETILADSFSSYPLPHIVRASFLLGVVHARLEAIDHFDGAVVSHRKLIKANAAKGRKKSPLTSDQWSKVYTYIAKRPRGVSVAEASRQAAAQLMTGSFKGLPKVRLESMTGDAIRKRWNSRRS